MSRRPFVLLAVLLCLVIVGAARILPAQASQSDAQAVYTVNTVADPGTGTCDATECTLREAIRAANLSAGADTIQFNVPGTGPHTIQPRSALPTITDTLTLDGASQPGFTGIPIVELDGTRAGEFANGLRISAGNSTVRGLTINRFALAGIRLDTSGGNAVVGNFIGTDVAGTVAQGNGASGIIVSGAVSNTIGGITPGTGNLISGNGFAGISITGAASGNQVLGNLVGTNLTGLAALGNENYGLLIEEASGNIVGGTSTGARNLVSGNGLDGIQVLGPNAAGNVVQGNFVGTDATGNSPLGNGQGGVALVNAANNVVGGTSAGARNLISANVSSGVLVLGEAATENVVLGNFIGVDANGTGPLGNGFDGVIIEDAAQNTVGGAAAGARNLISSNDNNGVEIVGGAATGNVVLGNFIGTDTSGSSDLGNGTQGVFIHQDASENRVGGAADARNVVSGNNGSGIYIEGASTRANVVLGNLVGTDASGTSALGNSGNGILISESPDNTIGAAGDNFSNLVSGNQGAGVRILGTTATGNQVLGNRIGTDIAGTAALGNDGNGLAIDNAPGNVVGGTIVGARNLISGNNGRGAVISGVSASGNRLLGNFIGSDASGLESVGNSEGGVFITDAVSNTIGGTEAGAGNLVSGNAGSGVYILGVNARANRVQGNFVGTDATGAAPLTNEGSGIFVSGSSDTLIGGAEAGARNVVSGNERSGVYILGSSAQRNQVLGNFIGTNAAGTAALGNGTQGVFVSTAVSNTIGAPGAGNLISGNGGSGVYLEGNGVAANVVQGNRVGTDVDGVADLGNAGSGVLIEGASSNNTVGGTAGERNRIAFNDGTGIFVGAGTGNAILSNSIYSNEGLGIDLLPYGVNANDEGDADGGSNLRQNFPVLSAVRGQGTTVTITATLNSTTNAAFRLQFFANDACDSSENGEGQRLLNSEIVNVATDGSGNTSFVAIFDANLSDGQFITATATDAANNTSEFSECVRSVGTARLPSLFLPLVFRQAIPGGSQ